MPYPFGDQGPWDLEPFENFSMTLQSLAEWMTFIFRPNKVASQQMHMFKPHQHRMYMITDNALAMPRREAKKKASQLWLLTTK